MYRGLGLSSDISRYYACTFKTCIIYLAYLFDFIKNVLLYVKFVLNFGGLFGGRFLIDLFYRFVAKYWNNTCVKSVKYSGGLLKLVSLMREWNYYSNDFTDNYLCVMVVRLNLH